MNLLNILNVDYEQTIKDTIASILEEYKDLPRDRTCYYYSSLVYERLRNKHIMARIISTRDIGLSYDHRFVLVREDDYFYLVDLTFEQFLNHTPVDFKQLLEEGYQKIAKDQLQDYLLYISQEPMKEEADTLFFR